MPSTASATAPTTNAPMSALLGCLRTARPSAPGEESEHPRVLRFGQELLRVSRGDHRLALPVEKHRVVADGEDARQLVGHHDDRGAEAVAQIEDEVIEPTRGDRIQTRGRLDDLILDPVSY